MKHHWNEEKAKELEKKEKQLKEMENDPTVKEWTEIRHETFEVSKLSIAITVLSIFITLMWFSFMYTGLTDPNNEIDFGNTDKLYTMIGGTLMFVAFSAFCIIRCVRIFLQKAKQNRMRSLPAAEAYEKLESEIRSLSDEKIRFEVECGIIPRVATSGSRSQNFRQQHETGYLLVYAGAQFDGKYDRSGARRVYVDGQFYGDALPWALLGLPSGNHSVFVQYVESVSGRIYELRSNVVSICADSCSMALFCSKNGMYGARTAVYDLNNLDRFLSAASSDGGPSFPY